jgi:non-homologous end joining protein Ku
VAAQEERPQGSNVVDLMDALKRSIGQTAPAKRKPARGKKRA